MRNRKIHPWPLFILLIAAGNVFLACKKPVPYPSLDKQRAALHDKKWTTAPRLLDSMTLVNDLQYLSSDTCEGRAPGTRGHENAAIRIVKRMREAGLENFDESWVQRFSDGKKINGTTVGENIVGFVRGTKIPGQFIIISAHYDHLGKHGDSTFYGASDNATGTACLLAMTKYFKLHPHSYSILFVAFDREETGLEGSRYFIGHLPGALTLDSIKMNLNLDMITRNEHNEIFACGIFHYPSLASVVDQVQNRTPLKILKGHDRGNKHDDWTNQSDHFVFHEKKIPFLYLGVEDHPDYHRPTDTFEKIDVGNFVEASNMATWLACFL